MALAEEISEVLTEFGLTFKVTEDSAYIVLPTTGDLVSLVEAHSVIVSKFPKVSALMMTESKGTQFAGFRFGESAKVMDPKTKKVKYDDGRGAHAKNPIFRHSILGA